MRFIPAGCFAHVDTVSSRRRTLEIVAGKRREVQVLETSAAIRLVLTLAESG